MIRGEGKGTGMKDVMRDWRRGEGREVGFYKMCGVVGTG